MRDLGRFWNGEEFVQCVACNRYGEVGDTDESHTVRRVWGEQVKTLSIRICHPCKAKDAGLAEGAIG